MPESEITIGILDAEKDGPRFERIADLAYYGNSDIAPRGGGFEDRAFYNELTSAISSTYIRYLEVGGEVAAYITSRSQVRGIGEDRHDVSMIEAVTAKEYRGRGFRRRLIENILANDRSKIFGLQTWRVDSAIYDQLPDDYPESEQPVHDLAHAIFRGEQIDIKAHEDSIRRIARIVKVDDANRDLGFTLVTRSNGERDSYINYVYIRPDTQIQLGQLDLEQNTRGIERIGLLRKFLTDMKMPDIYEPPLPTG